MESFATPEWVTAWVADQPDGALRIRVRRLRVGAQSVTVLAARSGFAEIPSGTPCLTNRPDAFVQVSDHAELAEGWRLVDVEPLWTLCACWGVSGTVARLAENGQQTDISGDDQADAFAHACARELEGLLTVSGVVRLHLADCLSRLTAFSDVQALVEGLTPRDPDRVPPVLEAFPVGVPRPAKREVPPPESWASIDSRSLSASLDQEGALSRVLPGYEPREGQLRMLEAVADAFNTQRHLMVEAGTGVGKSLAYLLPALAWAEQNRAPVVISTYTRNLQSQLAAKDVPLMAQALGRQPNVALIKGRGNYLCLRRLLHLLEHAASELENEEILPATGVLVWASRSSDGDLDDLLAHQPRSGPLLGRLTSSADECSGMACRAYRRCFLQQARARALSADIVIANHALVFSELDLDQVALPPARQIVFDEAHNLEDAATQYYAVDISARRLSMWLRRLWRGGQRNPRGALATLIRQTRNSLPAGDRGKTVRRQGREAFARIETVRADGEALFDALRERLGPRVTEAVRYRAADAMSPDWSGVRDAMARLTESLAELIRLLDSLCAALEALAEDELPLWRDLAQEPRSVLNALHAFVEDCVFVMAASSPGHVYWIQPESGMASRASLHAAPLDVSELLARGLYAERRSVIFCSATLSVNGNFTFLAERLGLDRIEPERLITCRVPSPFDYVRQVRVLAPLYLPEPNAAGTYEDAFCKMLLEVVCRTQGRTLVLFTSYAMLSACASALARPLQLAGLRLLAQGQGVSRDAITRAFRDGGRSVLFGTHSFWEGVDIMGDALSCVVLARLPFPALGDPLVEARCEHIAQTLERDSFRGYMLPLAVLRFRQGFGRLIRHRNDRGIVIVADRRMMKKPYGLSFRRDLPCPVSRYEQGDPMLADLDAFLNPTG